MDDQHFDDTIKSKLGEYNDPVYDPTALAALHRQIGAVSVMPWYAQYRTEFMIGSGLLMSTLVILWSQWYFNSQMKDQLNEKNSTVQSQQAEIKELQNEINTLKNSPPDTIRIIEIREQPPHYYHSLLYRIKLLEAGGQSNAPEEANAQPEKASESDPGYLTTTRNTEDSSVQVFARGEHISSRLTPRSTEKVSTHAEPNNVLAHFATKNMDVSTIRDIEDHYQKGIGIRLGPTIEFAKGNYMEGQSDMSVSYGMLGDFILSPSLSVETGMKYSKRYYEITDQQALLDFQLPEVDESIGTLQKAEIDSWMFELPVTFKYRYPFSLKRHLVTGVGYSSLLYFKQIFEYDYAFTGGVDSFTVGSVYETKQTSIYSGSINITLGMSHQLKNKKNLETSIFYQFGIGEKGAEKINANFLGIRGAYWFTVR